MRDLRSLQQTKDNDHDEVRNAHRSTIGSLHDDREDDMEGELLSLFRATSPLTARRTWPHAVTSERVKAFADAADRTNKVGAVTATYAGYAGNMRDSASLVRDLSAGNQIGATARERGLALALASNLLRANAATTSAARAAPG
ncbi:MAG: hypothetical protein H7287_13530 [Thermoleophilia bacterium]|nr:hypothetical protein [Thermoleophilia bacterium]